MRKNHALAAGIGSIALLCLTASPPASAQDTEARLPALSHDQALQIDAQRYAAALSIPVDEAASRLQAQIDVAASMDDVVDLAGDRFAGWWFTHKPDLGIAFHLTAGTVRRDVEQALAEVAPTAAATYVATLSERELTAAAGAVADELAGTPGVDGVTPDVTTATIVVALNDDAPATTELTAAARTTAVPVRFERAGGEATLDAYGGTRLSNACTSGFTVKNSVNVTGFLTAGHCGNSTSYALTPTGSASYSATYMSSYHNRYSDMQWHRGSTTAVGQFYGSSATTRTTRSGSGTPGINQFICHRGLTTGYTCGFVDTITFRPTNTTVCGGVTCDPVFVKVSGPALHASGGDSGGPWFSGGTAYGIHSGSQSTTTGYAWFTRITWTPSMGLTLL